MDCENQACGETNGIKRPTACDKLLGEEPM